MSDRLNRHVFFISFSFLLGLLRNRLNLIDLLTEQNRSELLLWRFLLLLLHQEGNFQRWWFLVVCGCGRLLVRGGLLATPLQLRLFLLRISWGHNSSGGKRQPVLILPYVQVSYDFLIKHSFHVALVLQCLQEWAHHLLLSLLFQVICLRCLSLGVIGIWRVINVQVGNLGVHLVAKAVPPRSQIRVVPIYLAQQHVAIFAWLHWVLATVSARFFKFVPRDITQALRSSELLFLHFHSSRDLICGWFLA